MPFSANELSKPSAPALHAALYWTVTLACGKATLRVASFAIKVSEALRHPRSSELWPSVWLLKDSRTLSLSPLLQVWVYGSWSHSSGSLMLQPKPIHRAKDPRNSDKQTKATFLPAFSNLRARSFNPPEKDGPSTSSLLLGDPPQIHFFKLLCSWDAL